ncbi:hypothetical protein E2562_015463 [Oryza meyeriana var. granulata]|uniref:Uncharacterized protein n=1 Tax=Oryza meyeriana var. granulata TaxID=110450 RepID=A0A6G1BWM8_9ORYZ|nr:hypothetical protein E2562_015463 [Oryza meyeriana var. granulata]
MVYALGGRLEELTVEESGQRCKKVLTDAVLDPRRPVGSYRHPQHRCRRRPELEAGAAEAPQSARSTASFLSVIVGRGAAMG